MLTKLPHWDWCGGGCGIRTALDTGCGRSRECCGVCFGRSRQAMETCRQQWLPSSPTQVGVVLCVVYRGWRYRVCGVKRVLLSCAVGCRRQPKSAVPPTSCRHGVKEPVSRSTSISAHVLFTKGSDPYVCKLCPSNNSRPLLPPTLTLPCTPPPRRPCCAALC